jgi:hypothetical protein
VRKALAVFLCAAVVATAAPLAAYSAVAAELGAIEGIGFNGAEMPAALTPAQAPAEVLPERLGEALTLSPLPAEADGLTAPLTAARAQAAPISLPARGAAPLFSASPIPPDERSSEPEASKGWSGRLFDSARDPGTPQVIKHDGLRFELDLDVQLVPGRKNVYRVGTYFFVPHALGITPATFTKDVFYQHIQRRIRFKTPRMSLADKLDKENPISPLNRLKATLGRARSGDKDPALAGTAYTEIRLLGVVASAAMRDQAAGIAAELPARRGEIGGLVDDARKLAGEIRSLKAVLADPSIPVKIRETATFLDEYLSLSIAEHFVPLLAAIRKEPALSEAPAAEDREVAELIKSEDAYRAASGYPSVVDKPTGSEALFYRRAVLKKYFSSVLDLETQTDNWSGAFQVLFSLSAAAAMFLYLVVMQFVQGHVPGKGVEFILVGMMAYVVKDRVKELLRAWTTRRWRRFFSDAVTAIRDPATGKVVGKVRESFGFVPSGEIPAEVLRIRQADPLAALGEDGKPEDVLHFEKEVTLRPKVIEKFHTRRRDLDDSLLINLLPFLENTEDPQVGFTHLDPASGQLEPLPGSRVYHINVVTSHEVRQPSDRKAPTYDRLRVVMDREGIKRIEKVPLRPR